ncbi:hypothetical protein K402DRAFT_256381 [Aulographum hederae CBS 113979]|uniref:Uncharacterized protein n=1 Tax=Aulographum hederae CBS 113979 TaxID=1176131 RepID=A0A6G1H8Z6_9PEZI|nr:hypothetical protein K402DRAFT_256381 [Aulographum hederae CBS 113979]
MVTFMFLLNSLSFFVFLVLLFLFFEILLRARQFACVRAQFLLSCFSTFSLNFSSALRIHSRPFPRAESLLDHSTKGHWTHFKEPGLHSSYSSTQFIKLDYSQLHSLSGEENNPDNPPNLPPQHP